MQKGNRLNANDMVIGLDLIKIYPSKAISDRA
jgi:hypothetical protein